MASPFYAQEALRSAAVYGDVMHSKELRAMFKCEFSKPIWKDPDKKELFDVLVKDLELPFPPYVGLRVTCGKFNSGLIEAVTWNTDKQLFSVSVEEEMPWKDEDLHLHTAEEIKKHLLKRAGWLELS